MLRVCTSATLVVVVLMLRAGSGLIRDSGRIFLEAAPSGLDLAALGTAMADRPHVAEVHDLHIWEITTGMPAASAHVLVEPREDCHAVRADLEELLSRDYGTTHLTLQVDDLPDPAGQAAAPGLPDRPHGYPSPLSPMATTWRKSPTTSTARTPTARPTGPRMTAEPVAPYPSARRRGTPGIGAGHRRRSGPCRG
jgi:hypothetical protein